MRWVAVVGFALLMLCQRRTVDACAAFGKGGPVRIAGEEAIIVWDEATKTEHFIRYAIFEDAPKDFAFLVPTPTRPQVAAAPGVMFSRLSKLYLNPPAEHFHESRGKGALALMDGNAVTVVEEKDIGGIDAAVLTATDADALATWLTTHHFATSPTLARWLTPYVKSGAFITAFKLTGGDPAMQTTAVRLSFAAERPFYPYSEPAEKRSARPLRVSFIASTRMSATEGNHKWSARVGYSAQMSEAEVRDVLGFVTPDSTLHPSWLTVFEEPKSMRGSDDLFFAAAPNKAVSSTIQYPITPSFKKKTHDSDEMGMMPPVFK